MKNLLLKVVHRYGIRSGTFLGVPWYILDAPATEFPCVGIILDGTKIEWTITKEIKEDDTYLEWN